MFVAGKLLVHIFICIPYKYILHWSEFYINLLCIADRLISSRSSKITLLYILIDDLYFCNYIWQYYHKYVNISLVCIIKKKYWRCIHFRISGRVMNTRIWQTTRVHLTQPTHLMLYSVFILLNEDEKDVMCLLLGIKGEMNVRVIEAMKKKIHLAKEKECCSWQPCYDGQWPSTCENDGVKGTWNMRFSVSVLLLVVCVVVIFLALIQCTAVTPTCHVHWGCGPRIK